MVQGNTARPAKRTQSEVTSLIELLHELKEFVRMERLLLPLYDVKVIEKPDSTNCLVQSTWTPPPLNRLGSRPGQREDAEVAVPQEEEWKAVSNRPLDNRDIHNGMHCAAKNSASSLV
ncbi:hypothetical protein RPSD_07950 [Ralstonia solanacearum]|nr:hypothetical protein RPSD_07950 [Ralstonia solanacearum]